MNARKIGARGVSLLSVLYIALLARLAGRIPLDTFNAMLAAAALPMVWLIGVFARWSAHQHSRRYERDVVTVQRATERRRVNAR